MLNLDAYIRVSTSDQKDSLLVQREMIGHHQAIAVHTKLPYTIRDWVVDEDESAKSLNRPGLQGVLGRMDRGEIDGLVVTKLDRLTRSVVDFGNLCATYFGDKVSASKQRNLVSVDGEVNTLTANGRLVLGLIIMVSQWERETIGERTKAALQHKIARGERCGKVRFGYRLDWDGPKNDRGNPVNLILDPAEQEVIAMMKQLRAAGRSYQSIADELTALGHPTRDEVVAWAQSSVNKILARASSLG